MSHQPITEAEKAAVAAILEDLGVQPDEIWCSLDGFISYKKVTVVTCRGTIVGTSGQSYRVAAHDVHRKAIEAGWETSKKEAVA